jgi:hypothetical protein
MDSRGFLLACLDSATPISDKLLIPFTTNEQQVGTSDARQHSIAMHVH